LNRSAVLAAVLVALGAAPAMAGPAACPVTAVHLVANDGLGDSRAAVAAGRLTVLAMGSSSVEGAFCPRPHEDIFRRKENQV